MKKWAMRQYWRLQQSQAVASLLLWTSTITLLVWPYVSWRFDANSQMIGIPMTYWGLFAIAALVVSLIFFIGYAYDQLLSLWRDHRTVDTERNPFGTYALIPANVVIVGMMNRLLRDRADGDESVIETCDWIDEWLAWCSTQEIWARSQKFWDTEFSSKVPDLFFLPDDAVEKARSVELDD
tara:strand:+ start:67 stop:609 length:543 start_codon:yes stop_codon:yes gene_type:complete